MNSIPHIIEVALLLLVAFLLGCIIGWFLRAKIFKKRRQSPSSEVASSVVESETTIIEKVSDIAEKPAKLTPKAAVADVKEAPKPASTSPKLNVVASKPRKASIAKSPTAKTSSPKSAVEKSASGANSRSSDSAGENTGKPEAGKPEALSAPRSGGKDDLKKIKGVGPKLENTLNGLGIYHFDQIAKWKRAEIDWVDDYLSFKGRIERDAWISQAKKFSS